MMKYVAVALFAGSAVATFDFPSTWSDFQKEDLTMESLFGRYKLAFARNYASHDEEKMHFELFTKRVHGIFDFNSQGGHTYTQGINRFTDMTVEERSGFVMPERAAVKQVGGKSSDGSKPVSRTLQSGGDGYRCDLRPFTTSVKDQASCGSCWAFGTMAAAEASHLLWSKTDFKGFASVDTNVHNAWQLSEQVLVDCCGSYGCAGCSGCDAVEPMECAVGIGALPSTTSHPYQAVDTNTCTHSASQAAASVEKWFQPCDSGDEICLKSYIGNNTCMEFYTTALKTSIQVIDSFYAYTGGVYSDPNCPSDVHNHAVAIVGWGEDMYQGNYWIVRNSWGPSWGESGYIKMARGSNMCCIACENLFFQ